MSEIIGRATAELTAALREGVMAELRRLPVGKTGKLSAPKRSTAPRRDWPRCSVEACGKSMFGPSAAARLCYAHYQQAGGKHPHQR